MKKIGIFFLCIFQQLEEMKQKMYTHVFGYFSNSMCEKKKICIYVFLGIFQNNSEKKKKKKFWCRNGFGLLPNCIVRKKKKLYCNLGLVLQEKGLSGRNYIVT